MTQAPRRTLSGLVFGLVLTASLALGSLALPAGVRAAADPVDLFVEALLDSDVDSLENLLAPNFVFIGSNGHIQDREHFIRTIKSRDLVVKDASFKNLRETSAGPVRLVTGNGVFQAVSRVLLPSGLMRVTLVADSSIRPRERIVLVQLTPVIPTEECEDGNCLIR